MSSSSQPNNNNANSYNGLIDRFAKHREVNHRRIATLLSCIVDGIYDHVNVELEMSLQGKVPTTEEVDKAVFDNRTPLSRKIFEVFDSIPLPENGDALPALPPPPQASAQPTSHSIARTSVVQSRSQTPITSVSQFVTPQQTSTPLAATQVRPSTPVNGNFQGARISPISVTIQNGSAMVVRRTVPEMVRPSIKAEIQDGTTQISAPTKVVHSVNTRASLNGVPQARPVPPQPNGQHGQMGPRPPIVPGVSNRPRSQFPFGPRFPHQPHLRANVNFNLNFRPQANQTATPRIAPPRMQPNQQNQQGRMQVRPQLTVQQMAQMHTTRNASQQQQQPRAPLPQQMARNLPNRNAQIRAAAPPHQAAPVPRPIPKQISIKQEIDDEGPVTVRKSLPPPQQNGQQNRTRPQQGGPQNPATARSTPATNGAAGQQQQQSSAAGQRPQQQIIPQLSQKQIAQLQKQRNEQLRLGQARQKQQQNAIRINGNANANTANKVANTNANANVQPGTSIISQTRTLTPPTAANSAAAQARVSLSPPTIAVATLNGSTLVQPIVAIVTMPSATLATQTVQTNQTNQQPSTSTQQQASTSADQSVNQPAPQQSPESSRQSPSGKGVAAEQAAESQNSSRRNTTPTRRSDRVIKRQIDDESDFENGSVTKQIRRELVSEFSSPSQSSQENSNQVADATQDVPSTSASNSELPEEFGPKYATYMKVISIKCVAPGCEQVFPDRTKMFAHAEKDHGILEFRCLQPNCNMSFKKHSVLGPHTRVYHRYSLWPCSLCPPDTVIFDKSTKLNIHHRLAHEEGEYQCTFCDFKATFGVHIARHVKENHIA